MKPKLMFWIDQGLLHFGLSKFIQENLDCELYSIFEVTENVKKFYKNQTIVNFQKQWFFHDYIFKEKSEADIKYLEEIEKKYNLNLQLTVFNDRIFYKYNEYYKFSDNEILKILYDEVRLFESILDEVKPDFILMASYTQQHNDIFCKICKARGIKIIMPSSSRIGISKNTSFNHSNRIYLSDDMDEFLTIPDNDELIKDIEINLKKNNLTDEKFSAEFQTSTKKFAVAGITYLLTNDENIKTHYSYYGRKKIKVAFKILFNELRKKYRLKFMENNLKKHIDNNQKFVYFPLHQEQESTLLAFEPFYTNQLEIIKNIANSLPVGYKLYVKEHPQMINRGWRSVKDMKEIMELPNVRLFHPTVNSKELIKKSKLVISIKGSSVIEAAFYNKPAISFSKVGMYRLSSISLLNSIKDLPKNIQKSLTDVIDENEVKRYEKYVYANTFEFPMVQITNAFESVFKIGGYYANAEIKSEIMSEFLEKYRIELEFLASKHIELIKT